MAAKICTAMFDKSSHNIDWKKLYFEGVTSKISRSQSKIVVDQDKQNSWSWFRGENYSQRTGQCSLKSSKFPFNCIYCCRYLASKNYRLRVWGGGRLGIGACFIDSVAPRYQSPLLPRKIVDSPPNQTIFT